MARPRLPLLSRMRRRQPAPAAPRRRVHDHVFVVTYGRSGSTLVQGLLNALPRTLVRGENGFYLLELYRATKRATGFAAKHEMHRPQREQSAFYGVHLVREGAFVRATRDLMTGFLLGRKDPADYDRIGFKEVLWHRIAPEETEEFFDWFERVFPNTRYVLNTRDQQAASTSGFWRMRGQEAAFAAMERIVEIHEFLRATRPDRVVDIRYEVLTSDDPAESEAELRKLAEFVAGGCDDTLLARLREVMAVGYGPRPFGASRKEDQPDG